MGGCMRAWRTVALSVLPRATRWTRTGRCGVAAAGTMATPSTRHARPLKRPASLTLEDMQHPAKRQTQHRFKRPGRNSSQGVETLLCLEIFWPMDTAPISGITIGESNSEAAWWDNHGKRAL